MFRTTSSWTGSRSWNLFRPSAPSSSATASPLHRNMPTSIMAGSPLGCCDPLLFLAAWWGIEAANRGRVGCSGWAGYSIPQDIGPGCARTNATDILQPHAMNHFRAGLGLISGRGRKASLATVIDCLPFRL